jgi:hypothetical protein
VALSTTEENDRNSSASPLEPIKKTGDLQPVIWQLTVWPLVI